MKYELDILESIIQDTIHSQAKIKEQLDSYYNAVNADFELIKKTFVQVVFSLKDVQYIKLYIQNHQTALIGLSDKVFHNLKQTEERNVNTSVNDSSVSNLQKIICWEIDNLLSFMRSYFPKYFNHNDNIPKQYLVVAQKELIENNQKLYSHLEFENNCSLLDIASYPLKKIQKSNEPVSFNRLIYIKKLCKQINDSCLSCSVNTTNCKLRTDLFYLNFNSYRFFSFLTWEIKQEYIEKDTICGQIEELSYQLKQINQVQVQPDFTYKPEQKSLKEQLLSWLIEEISYLEKKRELSSAISKDNKVQFNKDFKIVTENSVSQVAYFLKLLVEVGAITNKNQRELLQFFAANVKTKQTSQISPESLRTKFYHTNEGTIEAVKDTIIKLLNEVQNKN